MAIWITATRIDGTETTIPVMQILQIEPTPPGSTAGAIVHYHGGETLPLRETRDELVEAASRSELGMLRLTLVRVGRESVPVLLNPSEIGLVEPRAHADGALIRTVDGEKYAVTESVEHIEQELVRLCS